MHRAEIAEPESIAHFVMAGNAVFTLRSRGKGGGRFTYKVRALDKVWLVSVLTGQDNEGDFSYLGIIPYDSPTKFIHGGAKSRIGKTAPSYQAFDWFWRQLQLAIARRPNHLDQVEFWHEGRCGRCNRLLTVPESIEAGIGPECARKLG
jgi:hypothetical protein